MSCPRSKRRTAASSITLEPAIRTPGTRPSRRRRATVARDTATDGATPFRLSTHVGDVGHTLVVGPTGAGKSVLLATLAAQWLRYENAQVFIFDKERSVRATVLGLGGDFFDLGEEGALGLKPLEGVDDASERAWALDWIAALLANAQVAVTPELRRELWRVLELLGERAPEDRTLTLYAALLQDASARAALLPFTHAGPLGRILDHDCTTLAGGRVQAFEMNDLMRKGAATGAVLAALFHVLEARFDGRPTLLILDEAWLFLRDAFFAAQIQEWLKTLRKRNVAVIFASQELADSKQVRLPPPSSRRASPAFICRMTAPASHDHVRCMKHLASTRARSR